MPNPEWGVKRTCQTCGARFYDLMRDPILCPGCGSQFDIATVTRVKRSKPAAKPAVVIDEDEDLIDEEDDVEAEEDEDEVEEDLVIADEDEDEDVVAKPAAATTDDDEIEDELVEEEEDDDFAADVLLEDEEDVDEDLLPLDDVKVKGPDED
ncbi:MAG: TIGR02300 family protein [Thermohalobaculum sp.]|nr:TIGR02300 family protein [Thermohalobaculum sp.]